MFRFSSRRVSAAAPAVASSSAAAAAAVHPVLLDRLILRVSDKSLSLKPDDIFKLCVLANGRDGATLGLSQREDFVTSLRDAAVSAGSALSPFQLNQVKEMCSKSGTVEWSDSAAAAAAASASSSSAGRSGHSNVESKKQSAGSLPKSNLWEGSSSSSSSTEAPVHDDDALAADHHHLAGDAPFQLDSGRPAELQEVMDAMHSAKISFAERNTYDLRSLQRICDEQLVPLIPFLLPNELGHITSVLSHINHQDYTLAQHLSRRACQVAPALSIPECCRMLVKLYKLKVHDSLAIIVRRIEKEINHLKLSELVAVIHAAQLQAQTTASLQPIVSRALYLLSGSTGESRMSVKELVACVEVAAKFGQGANPASKQIVEGAARRAADMGERQLTVTLQSAHAMNLIAGNKEVFEPLAQRAVVLAKTMDVRYLEGMLDVFSLLPFNSGPFMDSVLLRLADDAGQLQPGALVSVLELVASYPGARGSTAVPAMAFAAFMRKEVLDQPSLTSVLLSLAQLQQFNDEFFQLFEFLLVERKGFKEGGEFVELLSQVPGAGAVSDTRFPGFVHRAAMDLVTLMSQEDAQETQRQLQRLRIEDRNLARRLQMRLEALNVESAVAEKAAVEATMRRAPGLEGGGGGPPHQQQHQQHHRHQNSAQTTLEWDSVPRSQRSQHQEQHHHPVTAAAAASGDAWGDYSSSTPAAHQHQRQQHHQQQQRAPQKQQQQQQRVSTGRPNRPAVSRAQQQQQQPKKGFGKSQSFKKSQWDGFIE